MTTINLPELDAAARKQLTGHMVACLGRSGFRHAPPGKAAAEVCAAISNGATTVEVDLRSRPDQSAFVRAVEEWARDTHGPAQIALRRMAQAVIAADAVNNPGTDLRHA